MIVKNAHFFGLPVSMITGEYPLFDKTKFPQSENLTKYAHRIFYGIKCTRDMDQSVTIPYFYNYEIMSTVYLEGVGWFFITGVTTSTLHNESLTFNLHYIASSSNIAKGESIKGVWSRKATVDYGNTQIISNKPNKSMRYVQLNRMSDSYESIPGYTVTRNVYWIQITSSNYLAAAMAKTTDHITRYGLFAVDVTTGANDLTKASLICSDGDNAYTYPSIDDIISNVDSFLGIESSSIIDISVIPDCPYQYSHSAREFYLTDRYGNKIVPSIGKNVTVAELSGTTTYKFRCYNLDYDRKIEVFSEKIPVLNTPYQINASLYDYMVECGTVDLRDWCGNTLGIIPVSQELIPLEIEYISDSTGLYTAVTDTLHKVHWIIPSVKLPWVGSQWETYKAYSMDTDRKSIQFAQEQYEKQWQLEAVTGVTNGLVGAGIAAASGGAAGAIGAGISAVGSVATSVISANLGRDLNNQKLAQDQELTESRIRASPGTAYNTAYGKNQLKLMDLYGAGVYVTMPSDVTQQKWQEYTAEFGHPTQGVQTLEITPGYYKGRILASNDLTGVIFTRLNEEFNSGLKFVEL